MSLVNVGIPILSVKMDALVTHFKDFEQQQLSMYIVHCDKCIRNFAMTTSAFWKSDTQQLRHK